MKRLLIAIALALGLAFHADAQTGSKIVTNAPTAGQTGAMQSGTDTSSVAITFCGTGYSGVLYVDTGSVSTSLTQAWTTTLTTNSDCTTIYTEIPASKWHRVRWTLTAGTLNVWMTMTRQGTTASYATMNPPTSATLGCVGMFLGSPLNLQCDAGLTTSGTGAGIVINLGGDMYLSRGFGGNLQIGTGPTGVNLYNGSITTGYLYGTIGASVPNYLVGPGGRVAYNNGVVYDAASSRFAEGAVAFGSGVAGATDGAVVTKGHAFALVADVIAQVGMTVMPDAGTDGRFDVNTGSGTGAIGVLGLGPSAGSSIVGDAAPIAFGGIAYVAPAEDQAITRGHYLCQSSTAGYVDDSATRCTAGLGIAKALYSEAAYTIDPTGCGVSCVNTTSETITLSSAPGWAVGDPVVYWNSGGTTLGGFVDGHVYFVKTISGADVTIAETKGGAVMNLTGPGNDATQYLMRLPLAAISLQ